jgi:hypothetical protein
MKGVSEVEEKAKGDVKIRSPRWTELQEKVKDNPQLSRQLEAAKSVMERYSEALRRLADS